MIVFGSLLVSLAITLGFYFWKPKEFTWWEPLVTLLIVLGVIFGVNALAKNASVMFTEYWGETIVSVHEEEPYNEWISRTCSETYACGSDSKGNTKYCTRTYDCSYQNNEGPSWWSVTNSGNTYRLTEHLYDSLLIVYGTGRKSTRSRRNYSPRDRAHNSSGSKFQGTKVGSHSNVYKVIWPKTDVTRKGVFTSHRYENRIKASDLTMFNIPAVTEEEADSMGLYRYPDKIDPYDCPVILGKNIDPKVQEEFRKLAAKFGPLNRLRPWVLVFEDKPAITGNYQENYWVRGNLNELVICIGVSGNEIEWVYSFSWGLNGTLTAESASKVLELYEYSVISSEGQTLPIAVPIVNQQMKKTISDVTGIDSAMLPSIIPIPFGRDKVTKSVKSKTPVLTNRTWIAFADYLNENLTRYEKRSHEEFSYIKVKLKTWVVILIYILALVLSVVLNIFMSTNNYHDKKHNHTYRKYGI